MRRNSAYQLLEGHGSSAHELRDRTTSSPPTETGARDRTFTLPTSQRRRRHRDGLGRLHDPSPPYNPSGYLLRPKDGRLKPLHVQDSKHLVDQTPWAIRIMYWIYSSVLMEREDGDNGFDFSSLWAWILVGLKLVPGIFPLIVLMLWPRDYSGSARPGNYDHIPWREWLYAASARNKYEDKPFLQRQTTWNPANVRDSMPANSYVNIRNSLPANSMVRVKSPPIGYAQSDEGEEDTDVLTYEPGPKFLCFWKTNPLPGEFPYKAMKVTEWMRLNDTTAEPDFVFISYTRTQFCVATDEEIRNWGLPREQFFERCELAKIDRKNLGRLGSDVAQKAGVPAFWIDFECLVPDPTTGETAKHMDDVFRICDIVRLSQAMVIVRGAPIEDRTQVSSLQNRRAWLVQWGSRLWTVPEALLCPGPTVDIYTMGDPFPESMLKRRLAAAAWDDAARMGQLMHHYEGTLRLSPLELVSIALQGLMRRSTAMHTPGDVSYCLMGLLRRRPTVNPLDGQFEAFARLSLSNDSDRLLERLLCFLPKSPDSPWYEIHDAWNVNLWDIEPHCQVAGLVNDQTITLDGAFGATIQWHKLAHVGFHKRASISRTIIKIIIRVIPFYLILTLILLIIGTILDKTIAKNDDANSSTVKLSKVAIRQIAALPIMLVVPYLMLVLYRGKFWSAQAHFFGMRGIPDLGRVEQCMFGINFQRLKWSANGSRLAKHYAEYDECIPLKPVEDPAESERMKTAGLEVFTIVDTFTMTATAFYAKKPPSVVLICGREGGMQRAILCSYSWVTQTFCRESVVRMRTIVLQRMARVDRVRFCLHGNERMPESSGTGF